ncbi:hypothetical protein [Campylobacter volucris]|uniref:hypothetical protein n=1 Tax=Campylobacter volucris TaxID=1031542 RepID=UPI001650D0A1|nr:hypothetical protein [Campylobacter volucris]
MNTIVLLGASNSLMPNRLRAGLSQKNINLINLSKGGCGSSFQIYNLIKNKNIIKKANLIILESNIVDINLVSRSGMNYLKILNNIEILFSHLSYINTKILILILPFNPLYSKSTEYKELAVNFEDINNKYRQLTLKYKFNIIDMQKFYIENNLMKFFMDVQDTWHPIPSIMYELGKNIADNLCLFKTNISQNTYNNIDSIIFKLQKDHMISNTNFTELTHKNFLTLENVVRLNKKDIFKFPGNLKNYKILGIHCFTKTNSKTAEQMIANYSSIVLKNEDKTIIKAAISMDRFYDLHEDFIIDENTYIKLNDTDLPLTENTHAEIKKYFNPNTIYFIDIVGFLLMKNHDINTKSIYSKDYKYTYDFNYLIPPLKLYKSIIEEYNKDSNFLLEYLNLKNSYNLLSFQTKHGIAKARIQNQLSYKLGQTLIINSKSIFGILCMPIYIISTILTHNQEQKIYKAKIKKDPSLKLPPLKNYPDYKEALKEKECLTYKLGQALIKANKTWYGGGVYKVAI